MTCPACAAEMTSRSLEEMYGRQLTLDICHACQSIWFDGTELLQLSPRATLDLFEMIGTGASAARPWPAQTRCPRCAAVLADSSDQQRATRFFFRRCPSGHGRLLTFFQFLRAKNFVRSLSEAEVHTLRQRVRQVNCSNCGAPVDIEKGGTCAFCRTPLAILDPAQVAATVAELRAADEKRRTVDPALPLALATERLHAERAFAALDPTRPRGHADDQGIDLILDGLRSLKEWISRARP